MKRLVCKWRGHRPIWTLHPLYPPTGHVIVACLRCGKSRYGKMHEVSPL